MPSKGLSTMDRRIPKSEKYAHIRSTLDTGLTVDKVRNVTAREFSKRRDEIYYRITKHQLQELFAEYEQDDEEHFDNHRSGGLNIVSHSEYAAPSYDKPYLILDSREPELFESCHILQARSFPSTLLRRDHLHKDIYKFKNKPESLIILYCNDEKISKDCAKLLVDRGIDNIYLLSGGLNDFCTDYPSYIEGVPLDIPGSRSGSKQSSSGGRGQRSSSYRSSNGLGAIDEDGSYSPTKGGALTPRKLDKHNRECQEQGGYSTQYGSPGGRTARSMSDVSVAESIISRTARTKGRF